MQPQSLSQDEQLGELQSAWYCIKKKWLRCIYVHYVLTHQECNQKLETETGECGVDGCGDGGGMLYGVGKRLLELWMGPLPLPVYARGLPLLWVFLGSASHLGCAALSTVPHTYGLCVCMLFSLFIILHSITII